MISYNKMDTENLELGNMDDDFENYIQALDLSKKMGKELIFYQSNIYLDSARSLSQHIFPEYFLTTMIGERHNEEWTCTEPHLSVADYVVNRVQNNNNIKVFLEYNRRLGTREKITQVGSKAVVDTYVKLSNINKLDKILPYDERGNFLGYEPYMELYHYNNFHTFDGKRIFDHYIDPFFIKAREGWFNLNVNEFINKDLCERLVNLRKNIENYFLDILDILNSQRYDINTLRERLKQVWQMANDWFVIRQLYLNNGIVEYIFIGGVHHFDYIKEELNNTTLTIDSRVGNKDNCVSIYNTYQFN